MLLTSLKKIDTTNYLLIGFSLFCFCLSLFRVYYTGTVSYLFLNWNLFLAIVPWTFSFYLSRSAKQSNTIQFVLLLTMWLLFFPNSPYILTDLFHLRKNTAMPIWYDLMLILSFAWTGLLFGFISLMKIEEIALRRWSGFQVNFLVVTLLFASGFGVYLGRFLRWNSWDMMTHPLSVLSDIFNRFYDPLSHGRTWGVTLLMGTFLSMVYFSIKSLKVKQANLKN